MNPSHKNEIASVLYNYNGYREKSIQGRWVKYNQLKNFLKTIPKTDLLEITNIGQSFEGRSIDLIKIGRGNTKVLFWSQMHGDESTPTRAILDLINFLLTDDDNHKIRNKILDSISLYIIPMLNPDGSEKFERRNTQLIDINRDAVLQQSPEAKILYKTKNEIEPEFGFNLHDQSTGYCAGRNYKSSTISLLAPPVNYKNEITGNVKKSMQLIVSLKNDLDELIPGHIARYDDEFEPRAFGDNFAKDNVSTILIEAGGWQKDPKREYVRKIYFAALIKSLLSISDRSFEKENIDEYNEIPENKENLYDLILRNVTIEKNDSEYKIDIAIKREDLIDNDNSLIFGKGFISDIGDLKTFYGYEEHDMNGFKLTYAKVYENQLSKEISIPILLQQGFAYIKSNQYKSEIATEEPINLYTAAKPEFHFTIDAPANFFLKKNNKIQYAVINGFLINLMQEVEFKGNGIVFH